MGILFEVSVGSTQERRFVLLCHINLVAKLVVKSPPVLS